MSKRNFRYIRFINGDNIVADVHEGNPGFTELRLPLQVIVDKTDKGPELILYPWLPVLCTDAQDVVVESKQILYTVPIIEKVANSLEQYAKRLYTFNNKETPTEGVDSSETSMEKALKRLESVFGPKKKIN